jgi:trehalose 6-phosphate phosphatase
LIVQRGKTAIELRAPKPHKGDAVRAFMEENSFRNTTPIYIGDDLNDEAAFTEAERLGGCGILVGPPRPTAARYRSASPPRVLDWLSASIEQKLFDAGDLDRVG